MTPIDATVEHHLPEKGASVYLTGHAHRASYKQELSACCGILLLSGCIMLPVFIKGFPAGFDAVRHFRWTSQFIDALADCSSYPRWLPSANQGQGSPAILYYPPLPFYVAAGFSLFTRNTLVSITLSCWLALVLSGLTMYLFSRSRLAVVFSFLAAALYMMAPYHLLDLFQGSSVSELWSFAWLPLLFDAIRRISCTRSAYAVAYLAIAYALLVLTHVPVLFLTSLTLVVYAFLVARKLNAILRVGVGLALGAGLGGIFLPPVIFETRYVNLFFKFHYRDYFLFEHIRPALQSPRFPANATAITYLLDNELIALGLLALLLVSAVIMARWKTAGFGLSLATVTAFSLLMTTRLSAPIWWIIPGLSYLFFPYRWLTISSMGTSLIVASCFHALSNQKRDSGPTNVRSSVFRRKFVIRRNSKPPAEGRTKSTWNTPGISPIFGTVALIITIAANLAISFFVVMRAPTAPDSLADSLSRRDPREYRPIWWDGDLQPEKWAEAAFITSGDASVQPIDEKGIQQVYKVNVRVRSIIEFRPLYFPGWVARVDGEKQEIMTSTGGHVQLAVESGEHILSLKFEDTWPRTAGKACSAASLLVLLSIVYLRRRSSVRISYFATGS